MYKQAESPKYKKAYERMGQETAKAMEGMGVYMDSKPVGKLVTPTVNNELGKIGKRKT